MLLPASSILAHDPLTARRLMIQNDTLLYRTVAQGEDGTWLYVNYWTSRDDMETLNTQAQGWTDAFFQMGALAKPNSFRLTSYAING